MRRRKTHRMRLVTWITDTTSTPNDVAVSKRKDYGDDWLKVVQLVENWDVTPMFIGAPRTVSICNFYPTALNIVMRILQIWSDYLASDQLNSRRSVLEGAWRSHRNACTKLLKWDPGSSTYPVFHHNRNINTKINPNFNSVSKGKHNIMNCMHALNKEKQLTSAFCMNAVNATHWNTKSARHNTIAISMIYHTCTITTRFRDESMEQPVSL